MGRPDRVGAQPRRAGAELPEHRDRRRGRDAGGRDRGAGVGELAVVALLRVGVDDDARRSAIGQRRDRDRPAPLGQRGPDDAVLPRRRASRPSASSTSASCASGGGSRSRWSAALGGVAVPILIYLAFNAGGAGAHGWGAAMSTDTAFALGALALLTPRAATRLRVFLLTLAVVDDLAALLVIATVYTEHVSSSRWASRSRCSRRCSRCATCRSAAAPLSIVVAVALWVAMFKSGIDPVISGLAIGLATSAYPPSREDLERGDGAGPLVPRAADAGARALGAAGPAVGDLAQRAAPVRAASLDQLRDRAAVRARQRRHPPDRHAAERRDRLADHARHPDRLRGRQAGRHLRRLLAARRGPSCTGPARR